MEKISLKCKSLIRWESVIEKALLALMSHNWKKRYNLIGRYNYMPDPDYPVYLLCFQNLIRTQTELWPLLPVDSLALVCRLIRLPWHWRYKKGRRWCQYFLIQLKWTEMYAWLILTFCEFATERAVEALPTVLPAHSRTHEGTTHSTALNTLCRDTHRHWSLQTHTKKQQHTPTQ